MTSTYFPHFIPNIAQNLTEKESCQLVHQIKQEPIATSLNSQKIKTTYIQGGEGELPILLLHGFDSSLIEFRRLFPKLTPTTETFALDFLGFGLTDRPLEIPVTPEAIKAHIYAFWKQLIERPMVLVGASMGGAAAIDFALTYPEIVKKLVLLDSAGFAGGPTMGKLMFPPLDRLAAAFLKSVKVRKRIIENAYYDRRLATEDALYCSLLHLAHPNWAKAIISFTKSGGYNFLRPKISQIPQETLIIWGEEDQILGTKDATRFESTIPDSELVWIPQSGHVPHLEKPELTTETILRFFRAS